MGFLILQCINFHSLLFLCNFIDLVLTDAFYWIISLPKNPQGHSGKKVSGLEAPLYSTEGCIPLPVHNFQISMGTSVTQGSTCSQATIYLHPYLYNCNNKLPQRLLSSKYENQILTLGKDLQNYGT